MHGNNCSGTQHCYYGPYPAVQRSLETCCRRLSSPRGDAVWLIRPHANSTDVCCVADHSSKSTWMIQSGVRPMRSILSSSFAFASASSTSASACTAASTTLLHFLPPHHRQGVSRSCSIGGHVTCKAFPQARIHRTSTRLVELLPKRRSWHKVRRVRGDTCERMTQGALGK